MERAFVKRGRLEIIYDILSLCRKPARRTRILYECNLSYDQLLRYLRDLISHGLLSSFIDERKEFYQLTDKGREFLDRYIQLNGLLEERENPRYTDATLNKHKRIISC